jgi:anaerobic ribonucleoside-triphosphate reductase activating protein
VSDLLRLHALEPRSVANGPGIRYAVWLQGCTLGCPGCFNPDTHPRDAGFALPVDELAERSVAEGDAIEGVSFTGGEPFEQCDGLLALVRTLRERTPLSLLAFSGFTLEEIRRLPVGPAILDHLDVLVDGRYSDARRIGTGLRGSSNQRIHLLSDRYSLSDVEFTPPAEILIAPDGRVRVSGIDPPR